MTQPSPATTATTGAETSRDAETSEPSQPTTEASNPATTETSADPASTTSDPTSAEDPTTSTAATAEEPTSTVSEEPTTTSTVEETTTTAYSGPVSPVTGMPVDDVALLDRKLVAVKVDNHWDAKPQSGLDSADAVYELVVEGGLTRFIALYHHSDSTWVGPMRSARPTDWTLVKPLNGVLMISGGQRWITSKITRNDVPLIGDMGPPLTNRWRERKAPHNLYVNTYEARLVAEDRGLGNKAPPTLFRRGPLSAPEGATAGHIFLDWTDSIDVVWRWDGARYLRSSDGEPESWRNKDGDKTGQISADVLIVLMAKRYVDCPTGDGSCVPAWTTVGENRAIVFAEGRYAEGRWQRDDAGEWFKITDAGGAPITIPTGRLWIMIYPETSDLVW